MLKIYKQASMSAKGRVSRRELLESLTHQRESIAFLALSLFLSQRLSWQQGEFGNCFLANALEGKMKRSDTLTSD